MIQMAKEKLAELKRKTQLAFKIDDSGQKNKSEIAKGTQKGEKHVDPSKLMDKLRGKIKQIHLDNIGQGEVDSKPTLSLLNVSSQFLHKLAFYLYLGN